MLSHDLKTSGNERYTERKSERSFAFCRGVEEIGRSRERGEQIDSWTRFARVQQPRM